MSPAWPVSYETLEPFYAEARADLRRAGAAGIDPTEPPRGPHPHAAIPHEPRIARLAEAFARAGLRPAPMPAAVDFGPGGRLRASRDLRRLRLRPRRQGGCGDPAAAPAPLAGPTSR